MFGCFFDFEKTYHPLGISKLHLNWKQRSSNCQRRAPFLRRVMKALREGGIFLRNLVSSVRYPMLISDNFCICSVMFWYHLGQLLMVWKTPCWNEMPRNIHQYPSFGWVFNLYLQETSTKPFKHKLWKKWAAIKTAVGWLIMKKWIFLYISSPLESRWSFSSPNLFHPLPPCPKRRGKWLPSGVFFTSWRFGRKQTRFKISIYSTGFQKKIWKNKQRIYRKINLAIPLCIYIYIQQGFHRKRFIKISEVLSSSWSQKRIMRRMLPHIYIYTYMVLQTLKGQGFCQTNSDTFYDDTCWREG